MCSLYRCERKQTRVSHHDPNTQGSSRAQACGRERALSFCRAQATLIDSPGQQLFHGMREHAALAADVIVVCCPCHAGHAVLRPRARAVGAWDAGRGATPQLYGGVIGSIIARDTRRLNCPSHGELGRGLVFIQAFSGRVRWNQMTGN